MTNEKKFKLDYHILTLLKDEPFFAALSRRINKRPSTAIPTAGVRVNPETTQFEMLYNPEFFAGLTHVQRLDVLKHEFYHIILEHVTCRKPAVPGSWTAGEARWHTLCNVAMDAAINSHLDNLPDFCVMPGKAPFEDVEKGLTFEQYLKHLLKQQKEQEQEQKGKGSGEAGDSDDDFISEDGQFDSHDEWADGDDPASQQAAAIAAERVKDFVRKAAEEVAKQGNGWGTVPADMRRDIISRLQTKVDWKKVLRYFIKTSRRSHRSSTVKRLNKRYRYIHAGKKVNRQANIAISVDQSGSVSDEMLSAFFGELNKLADLASFTVIPFDTRVEESLVYEWKKGQKHKTERVMCGGTCFDAPTKYVNAKGFDGHIVLTDMAAPKPVASKCQRMWMTTKDCLRYQYFQTNERILAIDA